MAVPPAPPNPQPGEVYCTVCMVQYAQGNGPLPSVGIVWLPTIWDQIDLLVCYQHGVKGYRG